MLWKEDFLHQFFPVKSFVGIKIQHLKPTKYDLNTNDVVGQITKNVDIKDIEIEPYFSWSNDITSLGGDVIEFLEIV